MENQETVQISAEEYKFLQKMVIEMGDMAASIHRLVTAIAPLIPKQEGDKTPNAMAIAGMVMQNFKQIQLIVPAIASELEILNPIYTKYTRLNEHTKPDTPQLSGKPE